jgi:hypothetical protein
VELAFRRLDIMTQGQLLSVHIAGGIQTIRKRFSTTRDIHQKPIYVAIAAERADGADLLRNRQTRVHGPAR